jgi:hypothetical protein
MVIGALAPFVLLLALSAPAAAADLAPAAETKICLPLGSLRQTIVRNDHSIDFVLRDGSVWRNTLPNRCPQLGTERAFSYQTSLSQLCRQDLISVVLQTGGQMLAARCGLGPFERQPAAPPNAR